MDRNLGSRYIDSSVEMSVTKGESEGVCPGTPRVSRDVDSFYEFGGGRGVLIDDDCSNSDTYNTGTMANMLLFVK